MMNDMKTYWNTQSQGYSDINREELETDIKDVWLKIINENRPSGEQLKVLDAGCGPGFFSILMSQDGHHVTAIDFSSEMLQEAKNNEKHYCGESRILFERMDVQNMNLEDNSFDLILTRNITWNLSDPEKAYREWIRVLKPSGHILVFDANWRLHLFHPYLEKLNQEAAQECIEHGWEIVPDGHDKENAGALLDRLPMADKIRPYWDVQMLSNIPNISVDVCYELPKGIMNEYYTMLYKYIPVFMIKIKKLNIEGR